MSLTEIIFGSRNPHYGPRLDPSNYNWRRLLLGAREIREIHAARTKVRDVLFAGWPPKDTQEAPSIEALLWHYGDIPQEYSECWEYHDGVVLVAIVMSTFAGTFASHSNIQTVYYVATPKRSPLLK